MDQIDDLFFVNKLALATTLEGKIIILGGEQPVKPENSAF